MTVSSTLNRVSFAGDDATTSFATSPVVFFDTSDLVVIVVDDTTGDETTLVENTGYSVSGGSGSTGTVDTSGGSSPHGALLSDTTLVILRTLPITQADDLVNNDILDAEVIEDALDRLVMIAQQQEETIGRSLVLPAGSEFSDLAVPAPAANKLLGWNAGATALENKTAADISLVTITDFVLTLIDDASAVAFRQTLLLDKHGADIASAATVDLDAATGDLVDVTGTTTITAITLAEGVEKTVRFTGALTLTHGASLVLPGAANITTAAGDFAVFRGYASGVVRCVSYDVTAGLPLLKSGGTLTGALNGTSATFTGAVSGATAVGAMVATQAEQEAATATDKLVSSANQHFHPSAAKGWANFSNAAVISGSYNVTSITDNAAGDWSVNWATDFADTSYAVLAAGTSDVRTGSAVLDRPHVCVADSSFAAGVTRLFSDRISDSADIEATTIHVIAFGDQA